ncbi:MAG: TolC family protein [Ectothiorhodospiraceae bacterium AqS1]|nr:TolC family protein [Ectothiorhodospiraceae bacterium AqS1]
MSRFGRRGLRKGAGVFLSLLALSFGFGLRGALAHSEAEPLPDPLTLEFALSLAEAPHPDWVERQAALAAAQAQVEGLSARRGLRADILGRARWIEPKSAASYQGNNDHSLRLVLRKSLWDAGRSPAAIEAAQATVESERLLLADLRHQRRLSILHGYFEVTLADLEFARENEAMAIAFIAANRAAERNAQGRISDIEVLERESAYQRQRSVRFAADTRRRSTRARLANLLDRPQELSAHLAPVPASTRELPDLAELENEALAANPALQAAQARVEMRKKRLEEARSLNGATLRGEIESGIGSRPSSGSDAFRAGVSLDIPLFDGGRRSAEVARRSADLAQAEARLRAMRIDIRQSLLEDWLLVGNVQAERESAEAFAAWRDLYLDRSRALYEQDVRADIGDAMVQISESTLRIARADFERIMALARIHALLGRDPEGLYGWLFGSE